MKLVTLSLSLSLIVYVFLLSSITKTYLSIDGVMLNAVILSLVLVSFFIAMLAVKQSWYDVASAYTPYEEAMGRLKRILSFMSLGVNLVNVVLAITYVLMII